MIAKAGAFLHQQAAVPVVVVTSQQHVQGRRHLGRAFDVVQLDRRSARMRLPAAPRGSSAIALVNASINSVPRLSSASPIRTIAQLGIVELRDLGFDTCLSRSAI